jgi:hypothetical protein
MLNREIIDFNKCIYDYIFLHFKDEIGLRKYEKILENLYLYIYGNKININNLPVEKLKKYINNFKEKN